jgi:hypothetical protein
MLTPSTQSFSHTSHKKGSLNPETFCTVEHWYRRTFAIFSLFILRFTMRAPQHRKTLTSKNKYRGFCYIKNSRPIRLPTFQWSTFRCFPQLLVCNTGGMSVYWTYSFPAFGVTMCGPPDGLSQYSGFPRNLIVVAGFLQMYTVTSAGDKGPVRSLKALNTVWGSTIKSLSNEVTSLIIRLAFLTAIYSIDVSERLSAYLLRGWWSQRKLFLHSRTKIFEYCLKNWQV